MKTKSTPKNNTILRVGDFVFDQFLVSYRVEDIKVLSSLIIYARLHCEEKHYEYDCDCAIYNRKATMYAEYICNTYIHKTFYFDYELAQDAHERLVRDSRRQALGGNLEEIIRFMK